MASGTGVSSTKGTPGFVQCFAKYFFQNGKNQKDPYVLAMLLQDYGPETKMEVSIYCSEISFLF